MGVMAVLIQSVWFSFATEVKAIVWIGFTVMVPESVATAQVFPVVVMLKANGDPVVVDGVPEMVKVVPATTAFTPAGKPVTLAPVAPPPNVYVMGVIAVFTQRIWASVEATDVNAIV